MKERRDAGENNLFIRGRQILVRSHRDAPNSHNDVKSGNAVALAVYELDLISQDKQRIQ
jgi:hypothetical protein